jgi:hypothetical protein
MIYIPLIYFSILLYVIIKTHGFDASASMTSVYVLTSFFAVLIKVIDYRPLSDIEINFIPTFFYCFLLTLTIYPFYRFNSNKINNIVLHNNKLFDIIVYIYFVSFLTTLIFNFSYLENIISSGNYRILRNDIYAGGLENGMTHFSGIIKYLFMPFNILLGSSYIMLLFYFYSICFLKKPKWFNTIMFISSLGVIIQGILTIDRSKTVYWLLFLYLVLVIFRKFFHKKQLKKTAIILTTTILLLLAYIAIVTLSRFGESDGGEAVITYAGQPFIFFCDFWDNLDLPKKSLQMIFPFTSDYILGNSKGRGWMDYIERHSNMPADVFFTSVGMFVRDVGNMFAIFFTFLFFILTIIFIKPVRSGTISFGRLMTFFLIAIIPQTGAISYFYNRAYKIMTLWFLLFVSRYFKLKRY